MLNMTRVDVSDGTSSLIWVHPWSVCSIEPDGSGAKVCVECLGIISVKESAASLAKQVDETL